MCCKIVVVISLDSPSCGVCLFDPRTGGCIGTLPDRPRIVPFEVRLSRCCLYGDGLRTSAGIILVVLPHTSPSLPPSLRAPLLPRSPCTSSPAGATSLHRPSPTGATFVRRRCLP